MEFQNFAKIFFLFGFLFFALGVLFSLFAKIPYFGKLPGDIYIKRGNFTFFFPLTTSLLLSIILTIIFWLISKFFK